MKTSKRIALAGMLAVSLPLAMTACKPIDKETGKPVEGAADTAAAGGEIAGLKGEREQISYIIGNQMGEQLKQIKDEIDLKTLTRAIDETINDKAIEISDEQAMTIMQAFGERMQAKQIAEMEEKSKVNAAEGEAFFAENAGKEGVQTTASGLQYKVITEGTGAKPGPNDTVRVHYKGTLLNGETFDSSYDRGEPAQFALNQVVPGWQEGLQLMPVGSKYQLWIPASLGYGEMGTGPIGPNQALVFEVELLDIVSGG
ncbi:FKBP-type peptidyl-prolyl cis-trans isomerase [Luteimonas sp. BDR2-5]|uniref:FKBP-type peptidyl-prolyl cis-trans isomerase n=1 Tax=Proluteimonas luteida TaxID=2878685 RepID=UPI001E5CB1D1|nr:FKBP-type peptidyl-prolyl cis-trans isomerase [Luteimonas sp. BDR2-5]MCD9028659.1 FKBP-type peptidyl-prolyl cis-trans isomerase [Luteimonas sp. BDR2-5]